MIRLGRWLLASKTTAGNAKNQAGSPRKKAKIFHAIPGTPVSPVEKLKEQRRRFGQDRYSRLPEYYPGRNVVMDPNDFTLYATVKGVMTIRRSRVHSNYRWLDVEPDINKVYRSRGMRNALAARGAASMLTEQNEAYAEEEMSHEMDADWRLKYLREVPQTEKFPDPNKFTRGLIPSLLD